MLALIYTMSSETRPYELKARADSQRETRERIAKSAAELHEELGVAKTTVTEIARRAGVTRLTVYNHFPDLAALLPACTAHYESMHPRPVFPDARTLHDDVADDAPVMEQMLTDLYGWYRETQSLLVRAFGDRESVPELDHYLAETLDQYLAGVAAELLDIHGAANAASRVMALLAVDFWVWRRLTDSGLDDRAAARLMVHGIRGAPNG